MKKNVSNFFLNQPNGARPNFSTDIPQFKKWTFSGRVFLRRFRVYAGCRKQTYLRLNKSKNLFWAKSPKSGKPPPKKQKKFQIKQVGYSSLGYEPRW
jgi:hypothetical protein